MWRGGENYDIMEDMRPAVRAGPVLIKVRVDFMPFPQAVLFDLDDTLISRRKMFLGFSECFVDRFFPDADAALRARALAALREFDQNGDATRPALFYRLFGCFGRKVPSVAEMLAFWNTVFPRFLTPIDGMFELLGRLREDGRKLALVTNGSPALQNGKIRRAGIRPCFDVVLVSGELGIHKPDPRIFRMALQKLGVRAENAVFVGDNLVKDIGGAQGAGIPGVWANLYCDRNESRVRPAAEIRSAAELASLIGGMREPLSY